MRQQASCSGCLPAGTDHGPPASCALSQLPVMVEPCTAPGNHLIVCPVLLGSQGAVGLQAICEPGNVKAAAVWRACVAHACKARGGMGRPGLGTWHGGEQASCRELSQRQTAGKEWSCANKTDGCCRLRHHRNPGAGRPLSSTCCVAVADEQYSAPGAGARRGRRVQEAPAGVKRDVLQPCAAGAGL